MIPAVPASPLVVNARVPEVGALTRAIGETVIDIIMNSARLNVIERCRRGFPIFSDSVNGFPRRPRVG